MSYWEGISIKAIAIGVAGGYGIPYILIKVFSYLLYIIGINQIFGTVPLLMVVLMAGIAPLASGYLGAKHSNSLPVLNGILATVVGAVVLAASGQSETLYIPIIVLLLAMAFGYIGARRFVAHG